MRIIFFLLLFLPLLSTAQDTAQYVLSSAGEDFQNTNTLVSWTIGEAVNETFVSSTYTISQGFHQGNLLVDRIDEFPSIDFSIKVYPNPVNDLLIIETESQNKVFRIIDIDGRIRLNGTIVSDLQKVDFSGLPAGTYFFQIEKQNTHKIIKH